MVLHCKKWMHLITTDVWLSGVVQSAAVGAGVAVSLAARHSGRGAHRDHATRAAPRRSDSRARYDLAKPPPVHVPVPKIKEVPAQLTPKCFQCSDLVVRQTTYLWYMKYHIRFEKPSRPICSNTVDLFKFPIDGLEGSTTSYMVFDVLRNSFHVCRKQIEVWKTKDTREALEWHCLLRCSWWQVERESPTLSTHRNICWTRGEHKLSKTNITYEILGIIYTLFVFLITFCLLFWLFYCFLGVFFV